MDTLDEQVSPVEATSARQQIIARGQEYARNLRSAGEDASSVEGFLLALEAEGEGTRAIAHPATPEEATAMLRASTDWLREHAPELLRANLRVLGLTNEPG